MSRFNLKSQLFKDTVIYGLTNSLYTGLPLLLMPFLLTHLSPEDYGIIDLFRVITMILIPIVGLSTVQSITRLYYDLNEGDLKKYYSTIIIFQVLNGIIGISIIFFFSYFIDNKYLIIAYISLKASPISQ